MTDKKPETSIILTDPLTKHKDDIELLERNGLRVCEFIPATRAVDKDNPTEEELALADAAIRLKEAGFVLIRLNENTISGVFKPLLMTRDEAVALRRSKIQSVS